jgi:hypothetical protein
MKTGRKNFFFEKKKQKTFANLVGAQTRKFVRFAGAKFNTKDAKFWPSSTHRVSPQRRNEVPSERPFLRVLRDKSLLAACTVFRSGTKTVQQILAERTQPAFLCRGLADAAADI